MTEAEQSVDTSEYESMTLDERAELIIDLEEQKLLLEREIKAIESTMLKDIELDEPFTYVVRDEKGEPMGVGVTFSKRRKTNIIYNERVILKRLEEAGAKERFAVEKLDKRSFNAFVRGETDQELRDRLRPDIRIETSMHMHRDRLKDVLKLRGVRK